MQEKLLIEEIELLSGKTLEGYDQEIFGEQGLMDSLNIFHIMLFIQLNYGIEVIPEEISLESFGTVNKIMKYIDLKTAQGV